MNIASDPKSIPQSACSRRRPIRLPRSQPPPASSPSISTPSSPTGASSRRPPCRPNAPAWSRPTPMAAAPRRSRARWQGRLQDLLRRHHRGSAHGARGACRTAAIYVLDGFFQNSGEHYAKINCRPVIGDLNELAEWDVFCRRTGWNGGAAIHIDTGMNRLGLTVAEAQGIIPRINAGDHGITLVMSHLVSAEQLNNPINARQLAAFREIASVFSGVPAALANSSGIFLGAAIPVRPGAAGRRALRRQSDAGSRQPDAAGRRTQGAHRADPQCRARRDRRLWRHLDRAAADQACDRRGRLCRRLFPRGQRQ